MQFNEKWAPAQLGRLKGLSVSLHRTAIDTTLTVNRVHTLLFWLSVASSVMPRPAARTFGMFKCGVRTDFLSERTFLHIRETLRNVH